MSPTTRELGSKLLDKLLQEQNSSPQICFWKWRNYFWLNLVIFKLEYYVKLECRTLTCVVVGGVVAVNVGFCLFSSPVLYQLSLIWIRGKKINFSDITIMRNRLGFQKDLCHHEGKEAKVLFTRFPLRKRIILGRNFCQRGNIFCTDAHRKQWSIGAVVLHENNLSRISLYMKGWHKWRNVQVLVSRYVYNAWIRMCVSETNIN